MTPQAPASPEESSQPSSPRSSLEILVQDATEQDLWAFDEEIDAPDALGASRSAGQAMRMTEAGIPAQRAPYVEKEPLRSGDQQAPRISIHESQIQLHVNKPAARAKPSMPFVERATLEGDFDDIDQWGQVLVTPKIQKPMTDGLAESGDLPAPSASVASVAPLLNSAPQPHAKDANKDEVAPAPPAVSGSESVRPHFKVSMIERIGIIFLFVILLVGGCMLVVFSLNRLPTEKQRVKENDFPIQGAYLTVDSAASYWRSPIMEGASMDTFRRGTQLLPELQLSVHDGPAMIRIYFRNEDRALIGDAVTLNARDGDTLKIAATAGFDDLGMHAAYRTGESKPWTVEVLEAPVGDASGAAFKKLFEMNISTDRR